MPENFCPACNASVATEFRFCPHCGCDIDQPLVCISCQYPNESNSKFCQECGLELRAGARSKPKTKPTKSQSRVTTTPIEQPPSTGITIEFPYSTAQSFDFAVECARKFPTFSQFGVDKKAVYRVTFEASQIESSLELVEYLKGWRRRIVYVDGEKVPWDSVFSFVWSFERKRASYRPEFYCFGFENEWEYNIWGCVQARLPFTENAEWFCWGQWLNETGDWKFDKERIRHELEKNLYPYRFCPALQPSLVEEVLQALPDIVNPFRDRNWKFVEHWGEQSGQALRVTVDRYGYKEQVMMKGVCPNGRGALQEMSKRLRFRLPVW